MFNKDEFEDENEFGAPMEPMTRTASPVNLRSYLEDLYKKKNLGDDERMKLEQSVAETKPGAGLTFLASLGAGLAGQDQGKAVDSLQQGSRDAQKNLDAFDAKRKGAFDELKQDREIGKFEREQKDDVEMDDPESRQTKIMQTLAAKMMPQGDWTQYTARQLDKSMPYLRAAYEQELKAAERKEDLAFKQQELGVRRQDLQAQRDLKREDKQAAVDLKKQEKLDAEEKKKKDAVIEVETRRQNINDNIGILEKMIDDKGTYETMGSHNQDMDRLVEAIATDMAKLADPTSVARPSEVDAVKKNLVSPSMTQRNSTALNILKNFRGEVDRRSDKAYEVRGLDVPAKQGKTLSAEDQQALDWAQSNPKDPRSAEIIKRLGM